MSSSVNLDEGEVTRALDMSDLISRIGLLELLELGSRKVLVAGPLESLSPGLVSKPVADDCDIVSEMIWKESTH